MLSDDPDETSGRTDLVEFEAVLMHAGTERILMWTRHIEVALPTPLKYHIN